MRAFVFLAKFIIAKYLKQDVDDNLTGVIKICSVNVFKLKMVAKSG